MNRRSTRILLFALVGAVVIQGLQWHFSRAWTSYYSRSPWPGYQQAMREGHVPAFLTTSPRSFLVGCTVLFSLPFLTLWFGASRLISSALALWAGVVVSAVGIWVATPQLREDSNLWPIDFALLAFSTGISL